MITMDEDGGGDFPPPDFEDELGCSESENQETCRLKVSDTNNPNCNASVVTISAAKRRQLGIFEREVVRLKSDKGNETICMVTEESGKEDEIGMCHMTRTNLKVIVGDFVTVSKVDNIGYATQIQVFPVNIKVPLFDSDLFADFVQPYFKSEKAVHEGDTFAVKNCDIELEFKILQTDPSPYCIVGPHTFLHIGFAASVDQERNERIAGYQTLRRKIQCLVYFKLKKTNLLPNVRVGSPTGILLHGPPGTGKSLMARTIFKNSKVNVFNIIIPEIEKNVVGEAENKLRKTFNDAKNNAPAVILIDNLEYIATRTEFLKEIQDKKLVTELINLMDGLEDNSRVIVIGTTNKLNSIEPKLRRPGRFDTEFYIGLPNEDDRLAILQVLTEAMNLDSAVDFKKISEETQGFSGANLLTLCTEAALKSIHGRAIPYLENGNQENLMEKAVGMEHFCKAKEEIEDKLQLKPVDVSWSDIVLDIKTSLIAMVQQIKNPESDPNLKLHIPKAILLYGPHGCGKSLLARAVATSWRANFITVNSAELFDNWYERPSINIKEYFNRAQRTSPCVLYFKEIGVLTRLEGNTKDVSAAEMKLLNDFTTEINNLKIEDKVLVIGSADRQDDVNSALLRSDIFTEQFFVPCPLKDERQLYLDKLAKQQPVQDMNTLLLAKNTSFYTIADLDRLWEKACKLTIREEIETEQNLICAESMMENLNISIPLTMRHLNSALECINPSLTQEDIKFWKAFGPINEDSEKNLRKIEVDQIPGEMEYI